jgi:hypothetical protein
MHTQFCEETSWKMFTGRDNIEVHFRNRGLRMEREVIQLRIVSGGTLQHKQPLFLHMALEVSGT